MSSCRLVMTWRRPVPLLAEELRIHSGQQTPDLWYLFQGGRLANRGEFLCLHELREVKPSHVRLDDYVRRRCSTAFRLWLWTSRLRKIVGTMLGLVPE